MQGTQLSCADLQEIFNGLHDKGSAFPKLDKQIAHLIDLGEFDQEVKGATDHHDKITKAISRLRIRAPGLEVVLPNLQTSITSIKNHVWQGFWRPFTDFPDFMDTEYFSA
ncbi:hypothetical protein MTO96_037139 [Rhipicephalus appendiculatus]